VRVQTGNSARTLAIGPIRQSYVVAVTEALIKEGWENIYEECMTILWDVNLNNCGKPKLYLFTYLCFSYRHCQ
jgi:hypothetical protein